jgi:hypothetical protein
VSNDHHIRSALRDEWLADVSAVGPPPSVLTVRRAARRHRQRLTAAGAAVAAFVAVGGYVSAGWPAAKDGGRLAQDPPPQSVPGTVLPCDASQLRFSIEMHQGPAGPSLGWLTAVHERGESCDLLTVPRVSFADASGRDLGVTNGSLTNLVTGKLLLRAGDSARASLAWGSFCGPPAAAAVVSITTGTEQVSAFHVRTPPCFGPQHSTSLFVGYFGRTGA